MGRITYRNLDVSFSFKNKRKANKWIAEVIHQHDAGFNHLAFVFCSDEALLEINKKYLQHDFYTDIITFDYSERNPGLLISGEMYISIDSVKENAAQFGSFFLDELHRVMIHGILHLLGYKDKTEKEIERMRKAEQKAIELIK